MLCFVVLNAFAQTPEFAPVGAKWWYELSPDIIGPTYTLFIQYEVEKDTIIDGIPASKIVAYDVLNDGSRITAGFEYFSQDSLSIAFYRNGAFHTFIDYSSTAGDTIVVLNEEFTGFFHFKSFIYNSFSYRIDSIKNDLFDGIMLKTFYVSSLEESDYWFGHFSFPSRIVKKIGAINDISILGFPTNIGFTGGIKGLTCYEEADEKLSFNGGDCDSLFVNLNDSEINNQVSLIYANELIHVQFSTNSEYIIQVTDIHGSIVLSESAHGVFYINRKQFSPGIYIIRIIDNYKNNVFTKKLFFNY